MKSPRPTVYLFAVLGLTAAPIALRTSGLRAAVTLQANDEFTLSEMPGGDLTVSGGLSVVQGIDFGTAAADPALAGVQFNYTGGAGKAAQFELTDGSGVFQWRDNLAVAVRDKMKLDGGNLLTLYKSDGSGVGIQLNPSMGQINLTGAACGLYAGGTPVFTLAVGGALVFGNRPFSVPNTTAAVSSTTGALTVAGGIGVASDSYINGLRVGRGGGNIATNTAYGMNALFSNTTGNANTGTGYQALTYNTTGAGGTANGSYSLYRNTTGYYNTASGMTSLYSNTTGGYNTAAGASSLYTNATGWYNTATGMSSLYANATGCYNTAAGGFSLRFNTGGSSNVAVGWYAGSYLANGSSLATPNSSIYIGANSRGFSSTDQNSIVIGANALGEGSNTTVIGNSSTLKTHLYGTVNASGFTVNGSPVLTAASGQGSALSGGALSGGALLAIGNGARASQQWAIAIGPYAQASGYFSLALGMDSNCTDETYNSLALTGGQAYGSYAMAAAYGEARGDVSMAFGFGMAEGTSSIALGGYDWTYDSWPANQSSGENSVTLGGVGNLAMGFSSLATGYWTRAAACHSLALGSLNLGIDGSADTWVDSDPLLELGNGYAERGYEEPAGTVRSNAITTLKNGQTTLTNKEWKANAGSPLADPESPTDSEGEALVVEGHTRLKGKVIIEQAQGDISMGIYGN